MSDICPFRFSASLIVERLSNATNGLRGNIRKLEYDADDGAPASMCLV